LEHAAEAMDLDLKHLQKIESGELNVTLVTLVRIAGGFRVPLSSLFSTTTPPDRSRR
jgi:transcriptional regulator with XRE-family HTH domain